MPNKLVCTMPPWSKVTKKSPSTSKMHRSITRASIPKNLPAPTASEAAFEALLRSFEDPSPPSGQAAAPAPEEAANAFIERAFAKGDEYLHDSYATIGDAVRFHTKLAGVSFEGRQDVIAGLHAGAPLDLRRQADNPHDAN